MEDFDDLRYSFCDTCKVTKEEWKKEVARLKRRYIFLKQQVLKSAHTTITALSDAQSKLELARSENKRLNEENVSVRERLRQKLLDQQPLEADAKQQKESVERLEADLKRVQDQSEAALQHNRQLSSLVADRDVTIKKLKENTEELKGSIAALKKELTAAKAERDNLLKKNLKTIHHSIKLCEILQHANLLPKHFKTQLLRQWKRQVNPKKSSDGELLERMLLSPDGVNSLCSQDTGFDSEEFCASDSDQSVRNEGIDTEDSFHDKCPLPLREETVVEESEVIESVTWHSSDKCPSPLREETVVEESEEIETATWHSNNRCPSPLREETAVGESVSWHSNSTKGTVVCSVEKTSRTSCEVFKVNENSRLFSIFEPSDSEGEELSLILSRTKLRPLLSPLPRTPIREICRTSVDVATCTIVETSSVAVGYDRAIGNSHSEETQTDFILDGCLSCIPRMSQNTDVPDDRRNMIQSSSSKETQTEGIGVTCLICASCISRSNMQGDKDPSCAQFRTLNTGMIRVDYLQKDNNQTFSRSPSFDGTPIGYITEDVDLEVTRTITRTYETEGDPKMGDDRQSSELPPDRLAQLPWRVGPRTQMDKEPLAVSDGLPVSDGENSLHLLSDGGGMYNSMLDSRDTEEIKKYDRKLPSRRCFRTEIHENSEESENENSDVRSDNSETRENDMDDVSLGKHIQGSNKYKRMKLSSGNVDELYDSDEYRENIRTARLRPRRMASTNEHNIRALDQPEGMNQRERRYDSTMDQPEGMFQTKRRYGSARFRSMNLRSGLDSRPMLPKHDGLGTQISHNTAKCKKRVLNDLDDRAGLTYSRVQSRTLTRPLYSPKDLGKCKVSKYKQNHRIGGHRERSRDTDTFSPRSVSPDLREFVVYNRNLDSDSHHSLQRRPTPVEEKDSKYSRSKYQNGRKRYAWVNPASSEAVERSTWNYLSDEAEERNSNILHNLYDESINVYDPEAQLIGSSDEEERYTGHSWRHSSSHNSSNCSTFLPEKLPYLNQKYMQQLKNGDKSPEIQDKLFSLARSVISKTSSCKSPGYVKRMFEKKIGGTDEHCCHHCICPSFRRDCHSQRQAVLQELRSCLNTPSKNSTLKAKKKFVQNRINERKFARERKRRLQELRQQIVTNRKAWLNKLSSQENGNSVHISSQNVSCVSESASITSDCLETIVAPECNTSVTSKPGVNVTEDRTNVGKNGACSDENNSHSISNADQNVEKCVSPSKMCSEGNLFGNDLESVGSSSPTDPNISVPCNPNAASDIHGNVIKIVHIVNNSLVSPARNLVEKPVENSVDKHNFPSLLGSTIINTPALPASKVNYDPLIYRCDISPIRNSDSLITPIKNGHVNLLSSTLVCSKSNDVHSSPEVNNDRPLDIQKEVVNNLEFTNHVSPLQKSSEPADLLDHSAVNKPVKTIPNITTDTSLASVANFLDHLTVNRSPDRALSCVTTDPVETNLLDSSPNNKSPNKDVSNITADTDLAGIANLFNSSAVSKSPNKDVSGTTSTAIANAQLNSEDCDNNDISLLTSGANFSTRIRAHLPIPPVESFRKEVLTELSPAITKTAVVLVDKKSFDCNEESPVSKSAVRSVSENIFGSDLESLNSSDSEDERPLVSRLPSPRSQSIGKSVEASCDQKETLFNSKPSDRDVATKQSNKLCSESEISEFTYAGVKGREKLNRTCHSPPPVLTDERASPLDSNIACPTVRRIAHQPKTYSALRKTRSLETPNVPTNKTVQGNMLDAEHSQQSDLLAPCPLPPKQLTKSLCKPHTVKKIIKPGKKLNKAMAQAKKIAECYKVPKLQISAVSTQADTRDSDGKRLYISSIVSPVESSDVVGSEMKGSKSPKLTPAAIRRLRAVELLKQAKMKPEARARREADSMEGAVTQREVNKSKFEKVVHADKDEPEKDHGIKVLAIGNIPALVSKETEQVEPPELTLNDKNLESSNVKVNNKRDESEMKGDKSPKLTPATIRRLRAVELLKQAKMKPEAQARREADSVEGAVTQREINKSKDEKVVDADKDEPEKDHGIKGKVLAIDDIPALVSKETEQVEPLELTLNDKNLESSNLKVNNKRDSSFSLDSVVRGRRSGRKSLNPCSKPQTPTNDAKLPDLSSVTENSTLKGGDKSSISPASPEIPACESSVHKPSVIPASPMNQCDGDSSAMVSPPSSRRCVQVLRLAMSMYSADKQQAASLAKQRPSDEITAEEKASVQSAFDAYLAAAFDSEALSSAVQKLANVSDVKIVAKCVVKYAADDKSEVVPNPPAPPLSINLKRLMTLVLALQREGPRWQILTEHILGGIEYKLFRLGHSTDHVDRATKLTLLYTSLCRIIPDRLRVQNFCLMALYSLKFKAHAVIYAALTVLPEALPMADVGDNIPLVQCLVYLLLHHSSKNLTPSFKVIGLKTMLNKVFRYKLEIDSPNLYLRSLIDKLKRGCLEVSPAIILLAKRKEWFWTLKFVLNSGLEPILQEWEQGTVSELVATEAVKLIGYILKCFPQDPNQSKAKVIVTINHFEKLLLDNNIDSHAFKETIASALVCLHKFDFLKVVNVFKRWQPKQPVSRNLCGHLQVLMRARSFKWWSSFLSDGDKSPMNNVVDKGAECSEEK